MLAGHHGATLAIGTHREDERHQVAGHRQKIVQAVLRQITRIWCRGQWQPTLSLDLGLGIGISTLWPVCASHSFRVQGRTPTASGAGNAMPGGEMPPHRLEQVAQEIQPWR